MKKQALLILSFLYSTSSHSASWSDSLSHETGLLNDQCYFASFRDGMTINEQRNDKKSVERGISRGICLGIVMGVAEQYEYRNEKTFENSMKSLCIKPQEALFNDKKVIREISNHRKETLNCEKCSNKSSSETIKEIFSKNC